MTDRFQSLLWFLLSVWTSYEQQFFNIVPYLRSTVNEPKGVFGLLQVVRFAETSVFQQTHDPSRRRRRFRLIMICDVEQTQNGVGTLMKASVPWSYHYTCIKYMCICLDVLSITMLHDGAIVLYYCNLLCVYLYQGWSPNGSL